MITNRDEVLENALRVFAKMNYEKASQVEIAKACGLSKAGLIYYYPFKLDLFVAVIDKYIFRMQMPENKFRLADAMSLAEFIDQFTADVNKTMQQVGRLLDDGNDPGGCSSNFYYLHLLMQVRLYYPDVKEKMNSLFEEYYQLWNRVIRRAKESGEIKPDLDVEQTASTFQHIFFGMSFEQSFFSGLDVKELSRKLQFIYSLLKA